jgi:pseudo-rSAM protein
MKAYKSWFYFETFVVVMIKKEEVLLYNSLNGEYAQFQCSEFLSRFIKRALAGGRYNPVSISPGVIRENKELKDFLEIVRGKFMGDILDQELSNGIPAIIKPSLYFTENLRKLLKRHRYKDVGSGKFLKYLNEVFLYINAWKGHEIPIFENAYKQFPCCLSVKNRKTAHQLKVDDIINFLNQSRGSRLINIHIMGGNLFSYKKMLELINYLNSTSINKVYHLYYTQPFDDESLMKIDRESATFNIVAAFPIDFIQLENTFTLLEEKKIEYRLDLIVQSERDVESVEALILKYKGISYSVKPYFNGNNLSFFKKHVFYRKKNALLIKPHLKEILSRSTINMLHFGKLTILNNGRVYGNPNFPSLGHIERDPLVKIIEKELTKGKSWLRCRKDVKPCKSCIYQNFCPPISNYEYVIGGYSGCKD